MYIFVSSRPEIDIRDILENLAVYNVRLHEQVGQNQDIVDYNMVLFGRTQGCSAGEKTNNWLSRRLQEEPAECEPYLSCVFHITANINSKIPQGALPA
jgi:hypothetical protein